jgi:hypothetical protein
MPLSFPLFDVSPRHRAPASVFLVVSVLACHRGPALTAWTTGEPNAPRAVAAVYRAVLDNVFPRGSNEPALIVIDKMTKPSLVEIDTTAKNPKRRPDAAIAPFSYRIPIIFLDTLSLRDLWEQRRKADSMAATVPRTDLLYRQRAAAPFIKQFPGAWGRLILGRVGFDRKLNNAFVDVWYFPLPPESDYGHELFRLARKKGEWSVIERDGGRYREGLIKAEPLPYGMLHAWVDSSLLPAPKRRIIRGSVSDSASGAPLPNFVIRIDAMPLGRQGQLLLDRGPESWGTVLTNSAGQFIIPHPPSGYVWLQAICPPSRDVDGAGLAHAELQPELGLDTVLNFRLRLASCAELAPGLAKEAERHRQDVIRAKAEAAARAVQGNIWGTLRDARTARPVARAWIRVDERGGIGGTDSLGRFWLWGFAPGKRKIIVYCPLRRQWLGKVATTVNIQAPPAMKDTMDILVDMQQCADVPVDTVRVRTRGVWSTGFEDGFFTPCKPFDQIKLGGYRDFSRMAYLGFAESGIAPPGGWPNVKPDEGYYRTFLDVEGDLIGPGSYGHLGLATYLLKVTRVVSAKAASKTGCTDAHR